MPHMVRLSFHWASYLPRERKGAKPWYRDSLLAMHGQKTDRSYCPICLAVHCS